MSRASVQVKGKTQKSSPTRSPANEIVLANPQLDSSVKVNKLNQELPYGSPTKQSTNPTSMRTLEPVKTNNGGSVSKISAYSPPTSVKSKALDKMPRSHSVLEAHGESPIFHGPHSVKSTVLLDANLNNSIKVDFARSREERELNKLQQILQLESQKAQERQRKQQEKFQRIEQTNKSKNDQILHREYTLRQKNEEALQRARENDRQLRSKREKYFYDKDISHEEHDRRVEEERMRQLNLRQQQNDFKNLTHEQRLQKYQENYQANIQSLEQRLSNKDITAKQYAQQVLNAKKMHIQQQSESRQDQIKKAQQNEKELLESNRNRVNSDLERKDSQTRAHQQYVYNHNTEIKKHGQEFQQQIENTIHRAQQNEMQKKQNAENVLNRKDNQVKKFYTFKGIEQQHRNQFAAGRQEHIEQTVKKGHDIDLERRQRSDSKLAQQFQHSDEQIMRNQQQLEQRRQSLERKRQEQDQRLYMHNLQVEQTRQEAGERFDSKIMRTSSFVGAQQQAAREIQDVRHQNLIARADLREQIRRQQAK